MIFNLNNYMASGAALGGLLGTKEAESFGAVMLIFVSDLHLVDEGRRASFKAGPLFEALRSCLSNARGAEDVVTLVLLGDVFELLKSSVWLKKDLRPWSKPTPALADTAAEILRAIRSEPCNAHFFDGLQGLRSEFGVQLEFLAGNHDGLLGDPECVGLRAVLREMIPGLPGSGDELFKRRLADEEHGVVAEHGHELDSFNRRQAASGRFVAGDAVVVELLVGLPHEVASKRKIDEFSNEMEFLHEMDNVEPQTLPGLMRWLEFRMLDVDRQAKRGWEGDVSAALTTCGRRLSAAMKANRSQSLARKALWTLTVHRWFSHVRLLRRLARIPTPTFNELSEVSDRVGAIEPTVMGWKTPPDIFVAGHTHVPLQKPFATASGHRMTYLNTGTWRRVHSPVRSLGRIAFQEAYYESMVCVHRVALAEQNGRFELKRYVRGL